MSIEERLQKFLTKDPSIDPSAVVLPGATVVGDVTLGAKASVFPGAVIRADIERVVIGEGSNVQDGVVIHLADDLPCIVGDYVTIGHKAMVHGCTIGDGCLIGMSSTILDGAVIGAGSIVAAGSVVPPRTVVPPNSIVMGVPAKDPKPLKPSQIDAGRKMAEKYTVVSAALKRKFAGEKI